MIATRSLVSCPHEKIYTQHVDQKPASINQIYDLTSKAINTLGIYQRHWYGECRRMHSHSTLKGQPCAETTAINMASDSSSNCDKGSLNTEDPILEPAFSIELLINRVEEVQRREQLEAIQKLTLDNSLLQQLVIQYQEQWCLTVDLLEKTHEAVLLMQKALERCMEEDIAAEQDWLAFWGIGREGTKRSGYSPAGWI
jgi:hypothetical protein